MYDFVDRPIASLDHGGRFLIWTLRNWVQSSSDGNCPAAAVGPAFVKWDMMRAFPSFHRLLATLNAHGRQNFSVAPIEYRRVSEYEAIFLALVHDLERRRPAILRDTVSLLVEEDYIAPTLSCLSHLGGAMKEAGIFPQKPQPDWMPSKISAPGLRRDS